MAPLRVEDYIARQLGVPAEEFSRYDWEGRAVKYHRAARFPLSMQEVPTKPRQLLPGHESHPTWRNFTAPKAKYAKCYFALS